MDPPPPEKDLESPSSTRLGALVPSRVIPATTEAAVRRPPWGLSVSVLRAGLALRAPRVSPGFDPCPFSVRGWVCGGGRGSLCRDAGLSRPHVISVPGLSLWEGLPCLRQPPKSARAALRGRGSPGKAAPFARSPWSPGSSGLNPGGGDSPRSPVDTAQAQARADASPQIHAVVLGLFWPAGCTTQPSPHLPPAPTAPATNASYLVIYLVTS